MKIPLIDLKAQYQRIRGEVEQAVREVLESQNFILGPAVRRLEEEVASYLQCGSAVGVASGSDALLLSLMALGISRGHGVLVPSFTFFSTVSSVTRLGATPVFVDVDSENGLIDPSAVEVFLAERCRPHPSGEGVVDSKSQCQIKALLPVHLYGRCCPMEALVSLAKKHHLFIVEDVAQAFGAQVTLSGGIFRRAGTVGDAGCFSFFPSKNLGGIGDGGLVATSRSELSEELRKLRIHGQSDKYHHESLGINSRLDEIQAAVLLVKLRHVERWREERIERARRYHGLFAATGLIDQRLIALPSPGTDEKSHVFNQYVIRAEKRDALKRYLETQGIQSEIYYPLPLHLQPAFAFLGYRAGDFPNAERLAAHVLALPLYPEITPEQQQTVVQRVAEFFRK